jgi:bacillithiol system protein YtxJ
MRLAQLTHQWMSRILKQIFKKKSKLDWNNLDSLDRLEEIRLRSFDVPQLLFKHSTRCSISSMAKNRLDSGEAPKGLEIHYLDLIAYRDVSNEIAESFGVRHESPQVLLIKNGKSIFDASHSMIKWSSISAQV